MPHRYFCSELQDGKFQLPPAEAQHAVKVMRNQVGDEIELFDGGGGLASAQITAIDRRSVTVQTIEVRQIESQTKCDLVVAAASPRGDRMKWMIEKLTELGVSRFIPLQTKRSVTDPGKGKLSKLEATVISACKQCRRLYRMEIDPPQTLTSVLEDTDASIWIAHPLSHVRQPEMQLVPSASQLILIGPEGGFTEDEVDQALQQNARMISWPNTILRIETAALMATVQVGERMTNEQRNEDDRFA